MRSLYVVACVFGLFAAAGCFNPKIKNDGFACLPDQPSTCPSGFYCVNHLCQDHPGTDTPTPDLSDGTGGGGGSGGGGGDNGGGGGSSSSEDMASPRDMSKGPPDLAQPPTQCGQADDDCSSQPCCSGFTCIPLFDICE